MNTSTARMCSLILASAWYPSRRAIDRAPPVRAQYPYRAISIAAIVVSEMMPAFAARS